MHKGVAVSLILEPSDSSSAYPKYCFEVIANFKPKPDPVFGKKPRGATDENITFTPQIKLCIAVIFAKWF